MFRPEPADLREHPAPQAPKEEKIKQPPIAKNPHHFMNKNESHHTKGHAERSHQGNQVAHRQGNR